MKIDVLQTESQGKNEFEIRYNDTLKYKAKLPFISIDDPLNLEKIRNIKIYDKNDKLVYTTNYAFVENVKEKIIQMKYLVAGSKKFNQLLFISKKNNIKIYHEKRGASESRYVMELNEKQYFCYSIEDGYIRHFPIYEGNTQIGEALKSNIVIDGKDEYRCYLKNDYKKISDAVVALLLYLDRSEYSSSYVLNKSYVLSKKYSYDKANDFYDKEWVKNNFGDEYYKKVDENVKLVKEKLKHPLKTLREQWGSILQNNKKNLQFVLIFIFVLALIVFLEILIEILLSK